MQQPDDSGNDRLDFVLDSEIRLKDIVFSTDLTPFFEACLSAGASGVALRDDHGFILKSKGSFEGMANMAADSMQRALYHEGEQIGTLCFLFSDVTDQAVGIADLAAACMQILIPNTVRRLLSTALHTSVVNLSYTEVLDANVKLQASEKKYRELAESLEKKVEARTGELKKAHARLLQQEKMVSTGQLAAGMAHEINNPLGFISSNINTFEGYVQRMKEMLQFQRDLLSDSDGALKKASELWRRLKIDHILQDAPELIRQSKEGAERVRQIVANLKGFSHVDDAREDFVEINEELDRTIGVLEHESRGKATFIRHYGNLPKYFCRPGLISQVFLNIIQNAIQASDTPVQIMITTAEDQGSITVKIEDDGPGIAESVLDRVFEPFFSTKDVGKGTGLGLSIAYDIVREHGGDLSVSSIPGEGAVFAITFPLKEQADV